MDISRLRLAIASAFCATVIMYAARADDATSRTLVGDWVDAKGTVYQVQQNGNNFTISSGDRKWSGVVAGMQVTIKLGAQEQSGVVSQDFRQITWSPGNTWNKKLDAVRQTLSLGAANTQNVRGARFLEIDSGGHNGRVTWMEFTGDGKRLFSADSENVVRMWNVEDPRLPKLAGTLRFERGNDVWGIRAGALSPKQLAGERQLLAIATDTAKLSEYVITLVDANRGRTLGVLTGHTDAINTLAFSDLGNMLCSASDDGTIRIWNLSSLYDATRDDVEIDAINSACQVLTKHEDSVRNAVFLPNVVTADSDAVDSSRMVTVGDDEFLIFWKQQSNGDWQPIKSLDTDGFIGSLALTNNGTKLVTGSYAGYVETWDVAGEQYETDIASDEFAGGDDDVLVQVAVSPDGRRVLTTGWSDDLPRILQNEDGEELASFTEHFGVWCGAWSPMENVVATAGLDEDYTSTIFLWNSDSGERISRISGSGQDVNKVAISADGGLVAFGTRTNDDFEFVLEQTFDWSKAELAGMSERVPTKDAWREAISEYNGLATETNRQGTKLFITKGDTRICEIRAMDQNSGPNSVSCWTFLPGENLWIVVGTDNWLRLYNVGQLDSLEEMDDVFELEEYIELYGHTGRIMDVACSEDGRLLVSGSEDDTVCLWNMNTGEAVLRLFVGVDGKWVTWSEDAEIFEASTGGERLLGWHTDRGRNQLAQFHTISTGWESDADRIAAIANSGRLWDPIEDLKYENPQVDALLTRYPQLVHALRIQEESSGTVNVTEFLKSLGPSAPTAEQFLSHIDKTLIDGFFGLSGKLKITNTTPHEVTIVAVDDFGARSEIVGTLAPGQSIEVDHELGKPWRAIAGFETVGEFRMPPQAYAEWTLPNNDRIQLLGEDPVLQVNAGGHSAICKWMAFTPDGDELISAGDDKVVRVWDVTNAKQPRLKRILRGDIWPGQGMIYCAAFCPQRTVDGRRILAVGGEMQATAAGSTRSVVRLFDYESGEVLALLECDEIEEDLPSATYDLTFSPDGRYLAAATDGVHVWDLNPLFGSDEFKRADDRLRAAIAVLDPLLSNSESALSWRKFLRLDELKQQVVGDRKPELVTLEASFKKLSGDSKILESAPLVEARLALEEFIGRLQTEKSISNDWLEQVQGDAFRIEAGVSSVAFVPFAKDSGNCWLALGYADGVLSLNEHGASGSWDEVRRSELDSRIVVVAAPSDGRMIFTADSTGQVVMWDRDLKRKKVLLESGEYECKPCLSVSTDGRLVVVGDNRDESVGRAIDIFGGKQVVFKNHDNLIFAATVAAKRKDGVPLVATTGGNRQEIILWNPTTGEEVARIVGKGRPVNSIAFSPDGRWLAFGDRTSDAEVQNNNNDVPLKHSFDLLRMEPAGDADLQPVGGWQLATTETAEYSAYYDDDDRFVVFHDGEELGEIMLSGTMVCYTLVPGKDALIVGTTSGLYFYDLRDFEYSDLVDWYESLVGHTGEIGSVAVSADGTLLVSGGDDQTIRLWDLESLQQIAAFFIAYDEDDSVQEWVVWTEAGMYKSSPAGDSLIGWHLNQGEDRAATFLSAAQLRMEYDRPEIIDRLFYLDDNQQVRVRALYEAVDIYNQEFAETRGKEEFASANNLKTKALTRSLGDLAPPTIEILTPSDGAIVQTNEMTLRFRVRLTPESIQQQETLYLYVQNEGRPVQDANSLWAKLARPINAGKDAHEYEVRVNLKPGLQRLSVLAETEKGVRSDAAQILVTAPAAVDASSQRPTLVILTIGVSDYLDEKWTDLSFADDDAEGLEAAFQQQNGEAFAEVIAKVITNDKATRLDVLDGFAWVKETAKTRSNVVVCVCVAGHGTEHEGDYFFVPHDFDSTRSTAGTGVRWTDFLLEMGRIEAPVILLMDTCHSAGVSGAGSNPSESYSLQKTIKTAADQRHGLRVFASSLSSEGSLEHPTWKHGAFTLAVLEALRGRQEVVSVAPIDGQGRGDRRLGGRAVSKPQSVEVPEPDADNNGTVDLQELQNYVIERVKQLTNGRQSPKAYSPEGLDTKIPLANVFKEP